MTRPKHLAIATFHSQELKWAKMEMDETKACLRAWARGLDAIPQGVSGQECNGHWDCSPVDPDEFPPPDEDEDTWPGPIRVFGRRDGQTWIGVSLRAPAGHELKWKAGEQPWTVDSERWGDWQSIVSAL